MRATLLIAVLLFFIACSKQPPAPAPRPAPLSGAENASGEPTVAPPVAKFATTKSDTIKPLAKAEQERLLGKRLNGGLGDSFGQFGNMFLVSSRLQLDCGVALVTPTQQIAESQLQPSFAQTYQPTLRELLDAIALQTSSRWKYDPSSKYFQSNMAHGGAIDGLAMFEFTPTKREKPFEVDLAEGWQAVDKGNWMMYVPPVFPVGMDIYELGTYSSEDKTQEAALMKRVRTDVALEWGRRLKPDLKQRDLGAAKVGSFDALFCEATISGQLNREIRWRQWVFAVGDKCYLVISTIFPELEDQIFPGVEKMLASFRIKTR